MSRYLTDAIVERGGDALHSDACPCDGECACGGDFDRESRAVLEAAAPLIAAKALRDAAKELHLGVGISALRITGEHAEEIARLALLAIADRIESES